MSNVLKVSHQETIRSLHEKGWSDRRIARELGINRRTVNRYGAKCTIVPPGKPTGRQSQCDPFAQAINEKVEVGLSGQRIYQDLVEESGFTGSYDAVKRFIGKLRRTQPGRVWRMESQPGEEMQVDFGLGAPIEDGPGGKSRRSWPPALSWSGLTCNRCPRRSFRATKRHSAMCIGTVTSPSSS